MNASAAKDQEAPTPPDNDRVAAVLVEAAGLLETQGANPYRVRAYRNAAKTLRALSEPVWKIVHREGVDGLMRLPTIGKSLAHSILHLVQSGNLPLLDRLRGENDAERLFATVANIGPKLAHRIHEELGIETLAELASASADGRLARVPGMGAKRLRAVRESLLGRFRAIGPALQTSMRVPDEGPSLVPVGELLDVDRQYRRLARQGRLPRIAPRRFNPTGDAWLPVLHTERESRHYTALFSNTARAHELGTVHDWVVIYRDDDDHSGCWTVITARYGPLHGQRIVRGHEAESADFYRSGEQAEGHRPIQMQLPM
jgi:Holliday junction resolvasome RuvABC DNA-binding subunit